MYRRGSISGYQGTRPTISSTKYFVIIISSTEHDVGRVGGSSHPRGVVSKTRDATVV